MTDEKDDSILTSEDTLIMVTPEGNRAISLDEVERMFGAGEVDFLPEGTEVSVTAPIDLSESDEELTLTGRIVGISVFPGMMEEIPAYIVKLDNPELVPKDDDGKEYGYSCMVFPIFVVTPIKKID